MYRLAKAQQYTHIEDFLNEYQSSVELSGWIAYERLEDELQKNRLIYAFGRVLYGDKQQQPAQTPVNGEKPIDTTDPDFVKKFKGLNYVEPQRPQRRPQQTSTEIITIS